MICVGYSKKTPFMDMLDQVGIKEQNDRIREFASDNGIKVTRFYEDKSDDPDSDYGFQELRRDGMNRRFDLVIFDSISRFGPNPGMAKNLLFETFSVIGINFIVLEDKFDSRNEDFGSIASYFDSQYNKYNVLCWKYSVIKKYGKERFIYLRREKYGYNLNSDGTGFEINEDTAKIIRLIFTMASESDSISEITRYLKKMNIPVASLSSCSHNSTEKMVWRDSVVNKLIRDRRYAGMTADNGAVYPAIISEELYERANKKHPVKKVIPENPLVREIRKRLQYVDPARKFKFRVYKKGDSSYKAFSLENRSYEIEMNTILDEVRSAVIKERELCELVSYRLDSPEAVSFWKDHIESDYKIIAKEIYAKSVDVQKDSIPLFIKLQNGEIAEEEYLKHREQMLSKLKPLDAQFNELIAEMKKRKKLFSNDNPWISRFTSHAIPDVFSPDDIKRYVSSIVVYEDGSIEVKLIENGKEIFGGFASEGDSYGT